MRLPDPIPGASQRASWGMTRLFGTVYAGDKAFIYPRKLTDDPYSFSYFYHQW